MPIYHKHFKKFRKLASSDNKIRLLEIGVQCGGSLDMWTEYFGKNNCEIVGLDIDPHCLSLEKDNIKIIIGNQEDKNFLKEKILTLPKFHIIIDDGGHTMDQQINSQEVLYNHVLPGGVYLCEDTSYWEEYGGGLYRPNTYIEYTKSIIDKINSYHYGPLYNYTVTCKSIHYYDSMVFFEKSEEHINNGLPNQLKYHTISIV